jgi:hypothetical protein
LGYAGRIYALVRTDRVDEVAVISRDLPKEGDNSVILKISSKASAVLLVALPHPSDPPTYDGTYMTLLDTTTDEETRVLTDRWYAVVKKPA